MQTTLLERLKKMIAENGPINVATFMQLCLSDPIHGYYRTREPIGRSGDFITAPEVSQLFGEMIGIWIVDIWWKMGSPAQFNFIELGPGRGTLSSDTLRTITKIDPSCAKAIDCNLVEISSKLRQEQKEKLQAFNIDVSWHEAINQIPDAPFILIANEFLDALPIRQFQFDGEGWAERMVGLNAEGELSFGLMQSDFKPAHNKGTEVGTIAEVSESSQEIIRHINDRLASNDGAALFIDYGYIETGFGDTLQAMRDHQFIDCLEAPGRSDLTAHVDFSALAEICKRADLNTLMTTQGEFLIDMGLLERAGRLGASLSPDAQEKIRNDVERLAAPEQMGDLFKVMAITSKGISPHGFGR